MTAPFPDPLSVASPSVASPSVASPPVAAAEPATHPMPRYLVCNGDATDLATWSNIPYFTLQAGLAAGLLQGGLALDPSRLRRRRRLWNLAQLLRHGRAGGYQYSRDFNRRLLRQAGELDPRRPVALLSQYPLLPLHPWPAAWRVDFWIDATSRQVFDDYGMGRRIAAGLQAEALERERRAYAAAGVVVCMCQWAADSVIHDYGIDPAKVHTIAGGGNLDEAVLAGLPVAAPPPPPGPETPLRLGFLGKEWQRKGGPFLLDLARLLRQRGLPTVIRAIGPDPASLPADPALEPVGFIHKLHDTARFVAEVRSWHFGALFSAAEAAPRANLECLRLGVPLIAHDVGGIGSTLPDAGCGKLFPAHPSADAVADWLAERLTPYDAYLAWRQALAERGQAFTWAAAMGSLAPLLHTAP